MRAGHTKEQHAEIHRLADEAWDAAWDEAREADRAAGRRYDKRIYAEKAHEARIAVLAAHGVEVRP